MSSVLPSQLPTAAPARPLTPSLVGLLAAGAGLSVAALYYSQPMLGESPQSTEPSVKSAMPPTKSRLRPKRLAR